MGLLITGMIIAVGLVTAVVFGFRWTRPISNDSLRRADDAQTDGGTLDPKSVRDRVRSYITIYGMKR